MLQDFAEVFDDAGRGEYRRDRGHRADRVVGTQGYLSGKYISLKEYLESMT